MKTLTLASALLLLVIGGCTTPQNSEKQPDNPANAIVDKAIEAAGGSRYLNAKIAFDFRGLHYTSERANGAYTYTRNRIDSVGNSILDILTNEGFTRMQNEQNINLPDSMVRIYSNSVNSVHYFMQLPYGLNDAAANKTLLDTVSIRGKDYFKIKVTFDEEGGGEDFEDVFLYWFDTEDYSMDYLAYSFHVDGGGMRFREAINTRQVEGITFSDYRNFKETQKDMKFEEIDHYFETGKLNLISKIENENIKVTLTK